MSSRGNSKGKNVSKGFNPKVDQLSQGEAGTKLAPPQDGGDEWEEVIARKSKNRSGNTAGKAWAPQNSNPRAWGQSGRGSNVNVSGRGNVNPWGTHAIGSNVSSGQGNTRNQTMNRGSDHTYGAPQAAIPPPLAKGWNWHSRTGSAMFTEVQEDKKNEDDPENSSVADNGNGSDESDVLDDSDEDLLSDDYDSDSSKKSHGSRKTNKWFIKFFESLDKLSIEQINEPQRQWHCPACQNGPGSIDWYGLQPLMTHARTKGARRVKLHRELAEVLDEELSQRGASVIPAGEVYGQWKGLGEEEPDHEIVWPPMVMIMNTKLDKDDNDKWLGMGNQELLEYFCNYPAVRARHSYGPQGHRGMSVIIFESNVTGYIEAERLSRDLAEQGLDRNGWDRRRNLFHAGKRQLYGFLATKEDIDIFNQHSQGKSRLKFEMKSYKEMVVKELRQISEDNQQLNWFKNKLTRQSKHAKMLEESLDFMREKLQRTNMENRIVRQRSKMQHDQNKNEMDSQDRFFKEQIKTVHEAREAQEEKFERLQQQERAKVKQQSSNDEYRQRAEDISKFIEFQEKEMEEFVEGRERLIQEHEKKIAEMKRRHYEEVLVLERGFDESLNQLMEKYAPRDL